MLMMMVHGGVDCVSGWLVVVTTIMMMMDRDGGGGNVHY
jgi:hypothetical protein